MALTDREVKSRKARDHAYRISDKGGVRGLTLQVNPLGQKTWILRHSNNEGNLERRPVAAKESVAPTVEVLLNGYVDDMKDRGRATAEQVQERLAYHVNPYIGTRIARDITEDDINDVLARIYRLVTARWRTGSGVT